MHSSDARVNERLSNPAATCLFSCKSNQVFRIQSNCVTEQYSSLTLQENVCVCVCVCVFVHMGACVRKLPQEILYFRLQHFSQDEWDVHFYSEHITPIPWLPDCALPNGNWQVQQLGFGLCHCEMCGTIQLVRKKKNQTEKTTQIHSNLYLHLLIPVENQHLPAWCSSFL